MDDAINNIRWDLRGTEVEAESFRIIEEEIGEISWPEPEWRVIRRLIHAAGDCSLKDQVVFAHNPIEAGLQALEEGSPLYADSNMIRSGVSVHKLRLFYRSYNRDNIHCHVADDDVARLAKKTGRTRALCALEKSRPILDRAIVLIGNAPLALAGLARMILNGEVRPRLVIAMPVGFVNVLESKQLIMKTEVPHIILQGRRGGSPLAVAALHGIMENGTKLHDGG
ncbi:MAG: precorrin-8X methylmutase [Deltaproteobacteria bacterium]|nr:precorrin-8X methylmutase [Deltaproteobacteria bacterium]